MDLFTDEEHPEQVKKKRPDLIGYIDANREHTMKVLVDIQD